MKRSTRKPTVLLLASTVAWGCSTGTGPLVSTNHFDGGLPNGVGADAAIAVRSQQKFVGTVIEKSADDDFSGEPIDILNDNGDLWVQLVGVAGKVRASMAPVAFAAADAEADAVAVQEKVAATFSISRSNGKITIRCGQARENVRTSMASTSGCGHLAVWIPSTPGSRGIELKARTRNGSLHSPALIAATGKQLDLRADNGSVDVGFTGSANVWSGNGDVTVDAVPTKGSTITVESENGDVALALQNQFAADALSFRAGAGVFIEGFSDLGEGSTSRGPKGTGAATITATASALGRLTVKPRFQ